MGAYWSIEEISLGFFGGNMHRLKFISIKYFLKY